MFIILILVGSGSLVHGIAVDLTSGNLYFTSAKSADGSFGISVISPEGDTKILIDESRLPQDIVLDPLPQDIPLPSYPQDIVLDPREGQV